jgi:hypothetical protein
LWSQHFAWAKRAKAWDDHLDAANQEEKEQEAKREAQEWADRRKLQRDRKWRLSQQMIDRTEAVLRLPLVRSRVERDGTTTIIEPVRVRLADAARLGDVASRLGSEAIEDARAEAEQTGAIATKITRAIFRVPWLEESEGERTPEKAAANEDSRD